MSIEILAGGLLSTVQDAGRHGFRHLGVGTSGALDCYSMRIANWLVGNRADAPVLEFTLTGPRLRFARATRIALCGAEFDAQLDGRAIAQWRPIDCPAGSELVIGRCRRGARGVMAVDGGLQVPEVLGSASTDLRGGFGGHQGRALRAGDHLALGSTSKVPSTGGPITNWWVDSTPELDFNLPAIARVLPGSDSTAPVDALSRQHWLVSAHSDRQGLRLQGAALVLDAASQARAKQRISEPVVPGTVQLPPDGQPIVLLADAQTHGGYPCIGHVIASDLPRLAQLRPSDALHFEPIDRAAAQRAHLAQRARLARIALAIQARMGGERQRPC